MGGTKTSFVLRTLTALFLLLLLSTPANWELRETVHAAPQDIQEKLDRVRKDLVEVKNQLSDMMCCTEVACNFCPLAAGKCPCMENITEAGVCGECYLGWHAGEGLIDSIKPEEVKMIQGDLLKQMYEMRARHFSGHDHSQHQHKE